jgi:hypothetical protein
MSLSAILDHKLSYCQKKEKACKFHINSMCGLPKCAYNLKDVCHHRWGKLQDSRGAKKWYKRCLLCGKRTYKVLEEKNCV